MITAYNTVYKDRYTNLFQEAMDVLIEKGAITDIIEEPVLDENGDPLYDKEGNPVVNKKPSKNDDYITSLDQYFTRIGNLAAFHSDNASTAQTNEEYAKYAKFLMIPLDEEYFNINANARSITVPANYRQNGVSVTEDIVAETLMFRIDRYFDFVDLMTTTIWVMWKNPEGQEGASKVSLIDYETEPGKILFGWPLTAKVVGKTKGILEFAIRFFKKDGTLINYSLNILPTKVEIKQGIIISPIGDMDVDDPSLLFKDFVQNSTAISGPKADTPEFIEGVFAASVDFTSESNTIIKAAATIEDTGALNYKWYYYPSYIKEDGTIVNSTDSFNITSYAEDIYEITEDTNPVDNKTYYIKKDKGYIVLDLSEANTFPEDKGEIYERYTELEIPIKLEEGKELIKGEEISTDTIGAGRYYVQATNRYGADTKTARTPNYCNVYIPQAIKLVKDLPPYLTLVEGAALEVEAQATVDFEEEKFAEGNSTMSYAWEFTNKDKEVSELDSIFPRINPAEIGWYKAIVTATRNGESLETTSETCKVTEPIQAPTISLPEGSIIIENDLYVPVSAGDPTETVEVIIADMGGELYSDGIEVKWYKHIADEENDIEVTEELPEIVELTVEDGVEGTKHAYITFQYATTNEPAMSYYIKVTNKLNNEEKSSVLANENGEIYIVLTTK